MRLAQGLYKRFLAFCAAAGREGMDLTRKTVTKEARRWRWRGAWFRARIAP
ncbi:hypothetical protein HOY34_13525 [Xinfangfangia sp. D13-10-4-6]|nr:hypothetical protein [Pseudogemmobacter hezensis]